MNKSKATDGLALSELLSDFELPDDEESDDDEQGDGSRCMAPMFRSGGLLPQLISSIELIL